MPRAPCRAQRARLVSYEGEDRFPIANARFSYADPTQIQQREDADLTKSRRARSSVRDFDPSNPQIHTLCTIWRRQNAACAEKSSLQQIVTRHFAMRTTQSVRNGRPWPTQECTKRALLRISTPQIAHEPAIARYRRFRKARTQTGRIHARSFAKGAANGELRGGIWSCMELHGAAWRQRYRPNGDEPEARLRRKRI